MATVKQIAEHLEISSATVSRVLNSRPGIAADTRKRVLDAAQSLGFSRDVGLRSSRYVGFVHPLGQLAGNLGEYHAAMIGGIGSTLGQNQYDLALVDPYRDKRHDESFSQFFLRKDLLGVILQVRPHNAHVPGAIAEEGFPIILVASRSDHPRVSWLVVDSAAGYAEAVEHLYHLGHRRIALVRRTEPDFDHDERVRGFERAAKQLGIDMPAQHRLSCAADLRSGASVIRRIASLPERPTAVVFVDPAPTRGALSAAAELGIDVPGDLSIVGFDDGDRRYDTVPSYTAVVQNAQDLGAEAAAAMSRVLAGEVDLPLRRTLPASFEVNRTTGPAPST